MPDDSDEEAPKPTRRKPASKAARDRSPPGIKWSESDELPARSTATQWQFDPDETQPTEMVKRAPVSKKAVQSTKKPKAHTSEPEARRPWLAAIQDKDRNKPGDPDYDPRTIYIPPYAWKEFSAFEKQYWEVKQNMWDSILFFCKGKFYELYENDAVIGHQLFDLKLVSRVNMSMVGVPVSSLSMWANQFVAKGYKVARVDQMETALGKELRERGDGESKKEKPKVITRELTAILTGGTLTEASMLQDDLATYCCAIKEGFVDGNPAFGIAFVDAATGQFFLTDIIDDASLTKFETFVAQCRPQELLLEKSSISSKALRILKNNCGPTTIWNNLKPGSEFWDADKTRRELECSGYFTIPDGEEGVDENWPAALQEAKNRDLLISATGALVSYLRVLKLDQDLISMRNFSWYDPIRSKSTLVLDGQTLINLEVFANSFDGGVDGTLFLMLNRCITPFGKRMFKQWVCHPLMDIGRINARLDAVDALNASMDFQDRFSVSLSKIPDLERLISRVHAGSCKAQDFLRVVEGFEQIEYTVSLLTDMGVSGEGLIGQLITSMPDLAGTLKPWKEAFDRSTARQSGLLVPEPGADPEFDESQERVDTILADLDKLLNKTRTKLGCNTVVYRDNGKEIYQLEVPKKAFKSVPSDWQQMSATANCKRYYFPELKTLVRDLQEAQETHTQVVKETAGRFYKRFDEHYVQWLDSCRIIAQLDCLISLAKASASLGEPSCRPEFVDDERSVFDFRDLRHPCMLANVTDFIPNDVQLGGEVPKIQLLSGANAAGKSTVLRMTCIAAIMAQLGCYVPCSFARMTPVDRIMSRLGANDNIFASQSTFFVELAETKKILSEATSRSLVILDELGRGTSSYDGVAVAQAVLHHIASHIGCLTFFATHFHSIAEEFASHPEIQNKRMAIHVDDENRRVTFLYKLESGVAEGSFGMHCAAMCGIPTSVIERAEVAAKEWEHTSRLKESLEVARKGCYVPLGMQSDVAWLLRDDGEESPYSDSGINCLLDAIAGL